MRIKNWVALLLALCLLGGMIPAAFAEELFDDEPILEQAEELVPEESFDLEAVASGEELAEDVLVQDLEAFEATLPMAGMSGWQQIGGKWYYYRDGAPVTGWLEDGGKWYYLNSDGSMCVGWVYYNNCYYYMKSSGVMAEGWVQSGGTWWYFKKNSGRQAYGWQQIDGRWYYFDPTGMSGDMVIGWKKIDGKTYYFSPSTGVMTEGWRYIDEEWYYFIPGSGARAENRWCKVSGKWYYFDEDGVMCTYWMELGGKWYYFSPSSGAMSEGWKYIDGYWYYFIPGSGAQAFRWRQIDGKWYYFDPGDEGEDGAMTTGWKKINGKNYYFTENGVMVTGTQVINGKTYVFSENGVLIGSGSSTPATSITDLAFLLDMNASSRLQQVRNMGFQVRSGSGYYEAYRNDVADRPVVYWESRICTVELSATSSPMYSLSGVTSNMTVSQARNALSRSGWTFQERTFYEEDGSYDTIQDYVYTRSSGGYTYIFDVCTKDYQTIYKIEEGRM